MGNYFPLYRNANEKDNILIDNTRTLFTDELSTAILSNNSTTTEFDINTVPEKLRADVEEFLAQ